MRRVNMQLEVGKKYPGKIMSEGTRLEYDESWFTLYYFLPGITHVEQESFRKGKYKFALTEKSDILFFLSEFKPGINLSDTPFHFGFYQDERINYLPKQVEEDEGLSLTIIAVDSKSLILKAIRLIGLSTEFSNQLIDICVKQSHEKVIETEYYSKLLAVQHNYQANDLLRFATIQCKG